MINWVDTIKNFIMIALWTIIVLYASYTAGYKKAQDDISSKLKINADALTELAKNLKEQGEKMLKEAMAESEEKVKKKGAKKNASN